MMVENYNSTKISRIVSKIAQVKYLSCQPLNQRSTKVPPNRSHILQTKHNATFRYRPLQKVPSTDAVQDNVLAGLQTP